MRSAEEQQYDRTSFIKARGEVTPLAMVHRFNMSMGEAEAWLGEGVTSGLLSRVKSKYRLVGSSGPPVGQRRRREIERMVEHVRHSGPSSIDDLAEVIGRADTTARRIVSGSGRFVITSPSGRKGRGWRPALWGLAKVEP